MLILSEPKFIERGPYRVVGSFCVFEGEDEGPGWSGAYEEFNQRQKEITSRTDDMVLGFLYRPHKDHPEIPANIRSCFVGVEVAGLDPIPAELSTTRFSGGQYVIVECKGDTQDEAAMGVGKAIGQLESWILTQGFVEGDACFAASHENAVKPPYIEYV